MNKSWDLISKELQKCILLCSNCHRELHAGLIDNSKLQSSYNEKRAEEISNKIEKAKHREIYHCKHCGKEITRDSKTGYCPECYSFSRRKVQRPNRETLKQEIRKESFVSLGKKYGVTDNAVKKWCVAYNLPK